MKRTFLLLSILFVAACSRVEYKEIYINNQYLIKIPDYMEPTNDITEEASLQYQNEELKIYTIVINESKEDMRVNGLVDSADIYLYFENITSNAFIEQMNNGKVSEPEEKNINGSKALIAEITGEFNSTGVFYKFAVIETEKYFNQVLVWTREDKKRNFEDDMLGIIESFREI